MLDAVHVGLLAVRLCRLLGERRQRLGRPVPVVRQMVVSTHRVDHVVRPVDENPDAREGRDLMFLAQRTVCHAVHLGHPNAAISLGILLVHDLRDRLPGRGQLLAPVAPGREKVDDDDIVVVHMRVPRRLVQRLGKVGLVKRLVAIKPRLELVVLWLGPLKVLDPVPNLHKRLGIDRRLAHRLGQVQLLRSQSITHVQRRILARERRERNVEVHPKHLTVRRPIDDHDALRLEPHVRPKLGNQQKRDEDRRANGERPAQQARLDQVLRVG